MGKMHAAQPLSPRLERMLDRVAGALEEELLPVEIFNDQEVFEAELDRIFTNTWVFVAHASEIPNPGDFVQRRIGLDPVIVTRDGDGEIHVLSNYCRHRGTQVCQTDTGNSRFFTCPYHGWTYSNNGDLVGTPAMQRAYGRRLDPKQWGLLRAAKVDSRQGFIFASLSPDVPSLEEYLGGGGWMLDLITGLHPDGMRVAGPPERYKLRADWKTAAENFAGDVYHLMSLHFSVEEIHLFEGLRVNCEIGRAYEFENGHSFMGHAWPTVIHPGYLLWGYGPEITSRFDLSELDETQLHVVNNEPPTVGTLFPNLSFIRFNCPLVPGGPYSVMTSFRQWQPIAPGELELWNWQFVWNFMSEEEAQQAYITGQYAFGSSGLFEQDDTVAWEGLPRVAASSWARKAGLQLHFQQGKDSAVDQSRDPEWKGPGLRRNTGYGEHNQLAFYRHWLEVMRGGTATIADGTELT
ncbi:aromatic ring-hydroxylating oxygenase subunit alpha [Mycobacterium lentiflavum]|uniref:Rieske 2Fe-2S domain-containing protein n=1 Tax=Mycobacterium lentiflavum TaxID=141349 RepID=A0ABY3UPS6_MYCLN|nr:Rieske 2Fe-2S domain-containing protein [Mycobacterium lentiflavum]ULP41586.1 Rieske 2Fe-2S domain-containing protein [Mycobacterium lentiflavum]